MTYDLSVVIPVRNGGSLLREQLSSLASQDFSGPWEVVVADNGSTDDSVAIAKSFGDRLPGLKVIDSSERSGPAYARNVGAHAATGQKLLFLDADDVVSSGYLEAMSVALDRAPVVLARLQPYGLDVGSTSGSDANQATDIGSPLGFLPYGSGGSIGFRRSVFEQLGGFSLEAPLAEDVDICWRTQLAGYDLTFVPEAVLQYRRRGTVIGAFKQSYASGRGTPWLYSRYRTLGMTRRSPKSALRFHLGPLRGVPKVRTHADVVGLAYLMGYRTGLVAGSLRFRCLYL